MSPALLGSKSASAVLSCHAHLPHVSIPSVLSENAENTANFQHLLERGVYLSLTSSVALFSTELCCCCLHMIFSSFLYRSEITLIHIYIYD